MFFLALLLVGFSQDLSQIISPVIVSMLKDVGGPVAAGFGGAIAGAACTYIFQKRNDQEKEAKIDVSTTHKTMVNLSAQLNNLLSIKKYNIYPYRSDRVRFLHIPKIPSSPGVLERLDPRMIDVALSIGNVSIIDNLYLAQARYNSCFENFTNRNLSLDEYRADLKKAGLGRSEGQTFKELYKAVGEGQLVALFNMAEEMIEVLDEAIITLKETLDQVNVLISRKKIEPGRLNYQMNLKEGEEYFASIPPAYFDGPSLKAYLKGFDDK